MARLIYAGITSLDGYVSDADGKFDWSVPDAEVHGFVNELEREIGTQLFGRRMYEVMAAWDTIDATDEPEAIKDFAALWRATDKIVYSTTLESVSAPRTRLEREFDPAVIRRLKDTAHRDLSVGGPGLAKLAIEAGLVNEYHQFVSPVLVGGGTRFYPAGVRLRVQLVAEHRFDNGVVHLHYRALPPGDVLRRSTAL
ncbi:dihydrofolate reductase family protein [Cryobacterium sp. HLT2-28]|uniref:dihydrofolate reductase family protein n=1 Tax=Cryobacterium sp. HLT2-28 TaxID=1259146 RepID=UPI00106BA2E0|nr:dihydrofolate reductase family protein [Cryobacterium sp. HLT2-28]TFB93998.1 deaminase [Cryobacterium sp. HLT2-28]